MSADSVDVLPSVYKISADCKQAHEKRDQWRMKMAAVKVQVMIEVLLSNKVAFFFSPLLLGESEEFTSTKNVPYRGPVLICVPD